MDRSEFFKYIFQKGFSLLEESAIGKTLDHLAEEGDDEKTKNKIRPPGAYPNEEGFLKRCTGCDACMAACPVHVILIDHLERRDPFIEQGKCIRCPGYPCIAACPTGALSFDL